MVAFKLFYGEPGVRVWALATLMVLSHLTNATPIDNEETCSTPIGIAVNASNQLAGFDLTSSDGIAGDVRLHGPTSWKVHSLQNNPFVQVTLSKPMLITGIQTQGDPDVGAWVVQFRVAYSMDCEAYSSDQSAYWANINNQTLLTHFFHNLTLAKCVRIFPLQYQGPYSAMRLELIGCDFQHCTNNLNIYSTEEIEPLLGNNPGVHIKLTSEAILTSLSLTYEAPLNNDVQIDLEYSRSCVDFVPVLNGQMTQLYRSPEYVQRQISRIAFYTPVRAQCIRVRPIGETVLEEVRPFGCGTTLHGAIEDCGHTRKTSGIRRKRVVGGNPVTPGEWPWMVSLHFLKWHNFTNSSGLKHLCGASLIDPEWVLTAAHCFDPIAGEGLNVTSNWRVALGEHDQSSPDGTEQLMEIDAIIRHPNFTLSGEAPILFDIALIKLKTPAVLSDYVNVVCLDEMAEFPPGSTCVVSGWGQDKTDTVGTKLPFMTFLPIMTPDACRAKYDSLPDDHMARSAVHIDDSVFCASTEHGGKDSCFGDSGGPFVCQKDNRWFQVGLVSIGLICGDSRYPGVYTKISHYRDWIYDSIRDYNSGDLNYDSVYYSDYDVNYDSNNTSDSNNNTSANNGTNSNGTSDISNEYNNNVTNNNNENNSNDATNVNVNGENNASNNTDNGNVDNNNTDNSNNNVIDDGNNDN